MIKHRNYLAWSLFFAHGEKELDFDIEYEGSEFRVIYTEYTITPFSWIFVELRQFVEIG